MILENFATFLGIFFVHGVKCEPQTLLLISLDGFRWDFGFSCKCKSMATAFIAHGPAFKKNFVGKPFESVSLYPLMCKALGIRPLLNNGSLAATEDLMVSVN